MDLNYWCVANGFVHLRNIQGTLLDFHETSKWLSALANTPLIDRDTCCVQACRRSIGAVSHVEIFDEERISRGIGIVLMCQQHHRMGENIGTETKLNGSRIHGYNVVKIKKRFCVWLMPFWYQNMIKVAEYMYIKNKTFENFDGIICFFERDSFYLKMNNGNEISKKCPF